MLERVAGHRHKRPHPALIRRGRLAHAAREENAEAPQAREAHLHAHVGHRTLPRREKEFGELESGRLSKLMWRCAEDRLELPNQMKGRDLNITSELVDRERRLTQFEQQIAGATETAESFVSEQHVWCSLTRYAAVLALFLLNRPTVDYYRGP